jgi:hypothetical protein
MHFHLPKPLHGWRAFAGEVGIIVLGVLIALAAEEFVRTIVSRRDANALRQSMVDELAMDRARWEANVHDVPCALKRLEEVRDWAGRPGSDRLDGFDPPAFWTMHDSAWQIARSSPVMTALPLKERDALADLYFVIGVQERILENAQNTSYRVDALAKTADRPQSRDALPEAAIEAQAPLRGVSSNFTKERFDRLGIRSNPSALGPNPFNYKSGCPTIRPVPPKG